MALEGKVSTNKYEQRYYTVYWEAIQSTPNNTSSILWTLVAEGSGWWAERTLEVVIAGQTVISKTDRVERWDGIVASGSVNVKHDEDGTKSFSISIKSAVYTSSVNLKGNGTFTLDTIPRYATSVQTLSDKTETTIKINWTSDNTVDYIWYSKDNGSNWTGINVTDGKSGNYTISGLSANTTYKIKTRVRRKDSQLTTDSTALDVTTYDYPHCTSSPNFTIGDTLTLSFYNPLSRSVTVTLIGDDGSVVDVYKNLTGTSLKGYTAQQTVNNLYSSIPKSQSGKYKVKVEYGSSAKTRNNGNTYKVKGTETPTINAIAYQDTNNNVVAITNNPQHIVQNQSNLQILYEPATPNYSAGSIAKFAFELNGVKKENTANGGTVDFGKVNSSKNLSLTVTVTDSRGLTAQTKVEITMLEHKEPSAVVTLERLNNYEDETYLTVDASVSSVNGKNTMKIGYRYKLSTDSYSPFVTIPNDKTQTLSCDKNSIFVFNVVVTDIFGSKFDREYILYKGVFPLFIDTEKNAVGINEFPAEGEALRVAGGVAHFEDGVKIGDILVADYIVEVGNINDWQYRKWKSGYAECWKPLKVEFVGDGTNTGFNCRFGDEAKFPFTFNQVNISVASTNQKNWNHWYGDIIYDKTGITMIAVYCAAKPHDGTEAYSYANITAVGYLA